jgi:hypothetical protein
MHKAALRRVEDTPSTRNVYAAQTELQCTKLPISKAACDVDMLYVQRSAHSRMTKAMHCTKQHTLNQHDKQKEPAASAFAAGSDNERMKR